MPPSRQRALIALRSFTTVKAAARSCGTTPSVLRRLALADDHILAAYRACLNGVSLAHIEEERLERVREANKVHPPVLVAERRLARWFAASGRDPRVAAAALHKRMNHEAWQTKLADVEDAIEALDTMAANRPMGPVSRGMIDVFDRWCSHCQADRVDDPCEVCTRHTVCRMPANGGTDAE